MAAATAAREWPPRPSTSTRLPPGERRSVGASPEKESNQSRLSMLDQDALDFLTEPTPPSEELPSPVRFPDSPEADSCASLSSHEDGGRETKERPSPRRSVFETLTESISGLWPLGEQAEPEPPVEPDSDAALAEGARDGGGRSAPAAHGPAARSSASSTASRASVALGEVAEDLTRGLQRLSVDISTVVSRANLWREAEQPEEPEQPEEAPRRPSSAVSPPGVDVEQLLAEARGAFKPLLAEVPELGKGAGAGEAFPQLLPRRANLKGTADSGSDPEVPAASSLSSVVRMRLIGHMVNCCEAVSGELGQEQVRLWHAFIACDLSLRCTLPLGGQEIHSVLRKAGLSTDTADACVVELCEQDEESEEADFVDILDMFVHERQRRSAWSFPSTVRSSIMQLLGDPAARASAHFDRDGPSDLLHERCALLSLASLAAAAAAFQRCYVLVTSWRCEQRVLGFLSAAAAGGSIAGGAGSDRGWPPEPLPALLEVLRGVNAILSPTERVLWELLSAKSRRFDGTFHREEVAAVMEDLQRQGQETEDEELWQLISNYQSQSIDCLFAGRRRSVTLADVFRWWWDMTAEFREASGLVVPVGLLSRAIDRCVEEMFRAQLRRAAEPKAARSALHGCSRAFAELCALRAARRVDDSFTDLAAGGCDDYREAESSDLEYMECVQEKVILT